MVFIPSPALGHALADAAKFQWTPVIEARERLEHRVDRDFNGNKPDNTSNLLQRYRLGIRARYGDWKASVVQQYAENLSWSPATNGNLERRDLVEGYVSHPLGPGEATLGRQRIRIGNEILIGEANWNNVSNAFDGIRWTAKPFDFFATKVSVTNSPSKNASVSGGTFDSKFGQTLYVFKHDDQNGIGTDIHTLSQYKRYRLKNWTAEGQVVGQIGHRNGMRAEAWAYEGKLIYQVLSNVSVFGMGAVASGGTSTNVYRTFDTLYGSPHAVYGLLDMQGWRNTQLFGLGTQYSIRKDLFVRGEFFSYGLRDGADAWYNVLGANRGFVDPTGKSGRDVGQEFALEARWDCRKDLSIMGGIGALKPGRFIKNITGDDTTMQFSYVQLAYRF